MTIVCGDSHTSTHGAFGALAFGIGTARSSTCWRRRRCWQRKPKNMRVTVDGDAGARRARQGRHPCPHRQDRHRRRHRLLIEYRRPRDPRPVDGRPHDGLQHVDRGGARAGLIAPDETTFDYLRAGRTRPRAPTGSGRRRLAEAADRRGRALRPRGRARRRRDRAAGHLGHQPAGRRRRSAARARPGDERRRLQARRHASARSTNGPEAGKPIDDIRSTACSSARAPTAASKTCARPPRSCVAGRKVADSRGHGRARLGLVKARPSGRPRPHLQRRRLRVARGGLLDVPGHEPRPARAGRALRLDLATATSKAARAAAAARTW